MMTLQGVIILRISDFRRFFEWGEFWAKREEIISLFRGEINRRVETLTKPQQEYYFVDNDAEFYLMRKLYEWMASPDKELQRVKMELSELKIETNSGEVLVYPLGRLQEKIEYVRKQNMLTAKTILGYTLLYLLLGADDVQSDMCIDFGLSANNQTNGQMYQIKEFEPRWNDVELTKIDKAVFPLRRCVIVNKNTLKDIAVVCGEERVLLQPNECVVGIFCGDKCLELLDNTATDNDTKISMKLSVKGESLVPGCEVHRDSGVAYIENVASVAVDPYGDIVYSTTDGKIRYNERCFRISVRVATFQKMEYSKEFLALKVDGYGNYIFYCKNKIDY